MYKRLIAAAVFCAVLVLGGGCYSGPVTIGEELSAPELIQRAQEASDRNRYNVSLQYYEAVLDRFYYDMEYVCAAEYEIAFINYKQKNYDTARSGFNALLSRYRGADAELLPQSYMILSRIVLEKIDDIESTANQGFFSRRL